MAPLSLKNISAGGVIVIMLTIMLIFGGLGFLYLSTLSIDQKNFQEAFNQSVVENRQRGAEDEERDEKLANASFAEITREQNQTAELMPGFIRSLNDTAFVAKILPDLIRNTENVTDLVTFLAENFGANSGYIERENFQYLQANNTASNVTEIMRIINETVAVADTDPDPDPDQEE